MKAFSEMGRPVHISLSGGSTPKMLFKLLASEAYATSIQWQNLHFWWGDERCVAPDDAESNYGEANTLLFSQVSIPAENIHRIRGEDEPEAEKGNVKFRRSLYVVKDIAKGELLTPENVRSIRPGFGLAPRYYEDVIGKKALSNIEAGTPLAFELFE